MIRLISGNVFFFSLFFIQAIQLHTGLQCVTLQLDIFSPDEVNGASAEAQPENTLQIFSHLLVAVAAITTVEII